MASGHTAKSAAASPDLSVHTVNDYLREARRKLGVSSSREAARTLEELPPKKAAPEGNRDGGRAVRRTKIILNSTTGPEKQHIGLAHCGSDHVHHHPSRFHVRRIDVRPRHQAFVRAEYLSKADRTVGDAALGWIVLVDRESYQESWRAAGGMFRSAVTAANWTKTVAPVRKPLGAVIRRSLLGVTSHSELPGAPVGDYRMVRFTTDFAEAPGAVETVVMQRENGAFRVVGYFVK